MTYTNSFTLRVCISGLGLIVPIDDARLKVLMPRTGAGQPATTPHRPLMRFDRGHLTQNGSPAGNSELQLDGNTIVIPDGASGQSSPWATGGLLDLSAVYGKHIPAGAVNGNNYACTVTIPPAEARCVANGHRWELKGSLVRLSWLLRCDIHFETDSVTVFGQRLYPFGNGIVDLTIVNEPQAGMGNPQKGDPAPHMKGLYAVLGISDPVPTFSEPVGNDSCDGWIPKSGTTTKTDAFKCMPAVATQ